MTLLYPYEAAENGTQLYDPLHLSTKGPINAKYLKAICPVDRGNPFIEALPHPLMDTEQLLCAYAQPLPEYDGETERKFPSEQRMLLLSQLRQVRYPLIFHKDLEISFYDTLCTSYRARTRVYDKKGVYCCTTDEGDLVSHSRLTGDLADAANAGFAVLGYSGCGKSSAMKTLLSRYPQTLFHNWDRERVVQIVYLVVSCVPNSNFNALYSSIGQAIDGALGLKNVYQAEIEKKRSLGDKLNKIIDLVEHFAIGIIIFDEIQLIDFSATKENSFESLLVLANRTKVAIAVIGTEDSYAKMFTSLRTARRIGPVINGSSYCQYPEFCNMLVKKLFTYQWFDQRIEPTPDILDAFYNNTHGIVDQLVGLYMHVQLAYLSTMPRPVVNGKFIDDVFDQYYSGVRALLSDLTNPTSQSELRRRLLEADASFDLQISKLREAEYMKELMDDASAIERLKLQKNVIANVQNVNPSYKTDTISHAFRAVMEHHPHLKEIDATQAVLEALKKETTEKRKVVEKSKKTLAASHDQMRAELLR